MLLETLLENSAGNKARHAPALAWQDNVTARNALAWLDAPPARATRKTSRRLAEYALDAAALCIALRELFPNEDFPWANASDELHWRRDPLGKPYVAWTGAIAAWAEQHGFYSDLLRVSNTHDGGAHLVWAAYDAGLVGVGIDLVHLPRLRRPGKDVDYLRNFARRFMSALEWNEFARASVSDDEEALRVRVAAHFSLMEAASKACGTGLKIGAGMGKPTSLPKQSLGVQRLAPTVEWLFDETAQARLNALGATRMEGHWASDGDYLVSVALLWTGEAA